MLPSQQCAKLIRDAKKIAVLTGAGISTNAGIPDFRGPQGLYVTKKYDADKVFSINYFYHDPKPFFEFAKDFIRLEERIKPTKAHHFLTRLEKEGKLTGVVTQNIDMLHQRAGTQNVLEMHGSFYVSFCLDCGKEFSFQTLTDKIMADTIARCECKGIIKPDIVFFGEGVKYYEQAVMLAEDADLFFVIGTSCVVHPAAEVPTHSRGKIVVVNNTPVDLAENNVVLSVNEDADLFFEQVEQHL